MNLYIVLHKYWIITGIENAISYNQASNEFKKSVIGTLGFQKYNLYIKIQELKKEIYSYLPKSIRKILSGF